MVESPVLYVTFARPEYASESFAAIKAAKPKKLYFYSNKARGDKPDEVRRNQEVRLLANKIDWNCELKVWFREEYVDVFTSLWGAIDWIFENEKNAIIIEEDVVASLAFFDYMDKMLLKYSNNDKVWMVSGNNAMPQYNPQDLSYFPTRFPDIYGWGSWQSKWKKLDKKLTFWPKFRNSQQYSNYYDSYLQRWFNKYYFNQVYNNISTYNPWDFIVICNMVWNNSYCLIPNKNLSQDIGIFGTNRQLGIKSPLSKLGTTESSFLTVIEPITIIPTEYDKRFFLSNKIGGLIERQIIRIKLLIYRLLQFCR